MPAEHWRNWLRAAMSNGIALRQFWRMSFAEWRAINELQRTLALTRADLDELGRRFPDQVDE
jgi:hypothetical protein